MSKWLVSGQGVSAALALVFTAAVSDAQPTTGPLSAWDKAALERARAGCEATSERRSV
jgi:hypothetical protein